ncbi:MAG: M20/M25/M40 family metallo-hydrolase [Aeriscardovia sp.]|nr:M20/M25/M40 family metallo-hydrolase [Aeriscardovia sp.]MBQ1301365.1 M20/M25/M40 family metallo-hydrolase [Aeriscardovia sp.]MBQ5556931.1 M20/M25/M40 family metallo-hydrolase [Aeriscardovia sp.]
MSSESAKNPTLEEISAKVDAGWDGFVSTLEKKIALKAVSAEGISSPTMKASAEFVAQCLRDAGIDNARVEQAVQEDGEPGAWEVVGQKDVGADKTVLLYAHHDVQPAGDEASWKTPPFKGVIEGGRLYGRGSSDDGGGIMTHVGALTALKGNLKCNVKVFIEGEEEMGSPSFVPFLNAHPDYFDSDVMFITDSSNWSAKIPSLTASLRGNVTMDVTVKCLGHPVHSGTFGGPILDANTLSSMIVSSFYDREGNVVVPGLIQGEPIGGLKEDLSEADFRKDSSLLPSCRLAGSGSLASRLWTKPAIALTGMDIRPVKEAFNQLASECTFRLSVRTSPLQKAEDAAEALKDFILKNPPFGCQIDIKVLETGTGWAMDPDNPVVAQAEKCFQAVFGCAPENKGEGGSIPMIPILQAKFPKANVLVDGPEDPLTNAHAPNESQDLSELRGDMEAEALLLSTL